MKTRAAVAFEKAKPLEVVCESRNVAHRRIAALQAADSAFTETIHGPT